MRKLLLGVALAGITASIALIAQSQLKDGEEAAQRERVDTASVQSVYPRPVPAQPAPARGDTQPAPGVTPATPAAPAPAVKKPYIKDVPTVVQTEEAQATGASVLKNAASAYAKVSTLQANFTQKRENPLLGSVTNSRGTLYQKRPDRFLMKFSQPAGDVILSDGRYFWVYYPSADRKQVLRAPATQGAAGGVDLQAQFLGDPLTRFSHTYHGLQDGMHVITMIPRTNTGYKSLKVWVDAKDSMVRRFILTENNGVVVEIALSGLVVNKPLSNDLFKFTPPADARIIENP